MRTYSEMMKLNTFKERFEYLLLDGKVGEETFGGKRVLNQMFYSSPEWKLLRSKIIIRDSFSESVCDLAHPDYPIFGNVYVHHIEPITDYDIINRTSKLTDPDNLICVSFETHNAITYGNKNYSNEFILVERRPNDTCPWLIKGVNHNE